MTVKRISAIVSILIIAVSASVNAGAELFRWGVRGGITVNSLHFSGSTFDSSNRMGYTFGLAGELNLPVLPFSVDAAVMYSHREFNVSLIGDDNQKYSASKGSDYIEIPVDFRWNISIPAVSSIVKPYLFTGPSFAFLMGKRNVGDSFKRSNANVDWNFGFGLELLRHLQVSASYGLGLSKAYEGDASGRNRCWVVTATYLF